MFIAKNTSKKSSRGQSLVEVALIMPILLMILASMVEVSNILITKNRVETAARAAARHASNGGDDTYIVVLNSVTQTLDLSEGLWDIWTIEAHTNDSGDGFANGDWVVNHIYGISQTNSFTQVSSRIAEDCVSDCISTILIGQLQKDEQGNQNNIIAADLDIVGVFIIHDIQSILGLNAVPAYQGFSSVEGLGVMRTAALSVVDTTEGCTVVFPFGVSNGSRSVEQAEYDSFKTQMTYPATPPSYFSFSYHNPGVPIAQATDGDIHRFSFEYAEAAWLRWNQKLEQTNGNLAASLAWPGNSFEYGDCRTQGCTLINPALPGFWGFAEAGDMDDRALHINDRVTANLGGSISGVTAQLNNHINNNRAIRLPMSDSFALGYPPLSDGTPYYTVREFAVFRIRGYSTSNNWILLEFVRKDTSCGNE